MESNLALSFGCSFASPQSTTRLALDLPLIMALVLQCMRHADKVFVSWREDSASAKSSDVDATLGSDSDDLYPEGLSGGQLLAMVKEMSLTLQSGKVSVEEIASFASKHLALLPGEDVTRIAKTATSDSEGKYNFVEVLFPPVGPIVTYVTFQISVALATLARGSVEDTLSLVCVPSPRTLSPLPFSMSSSFLFQQQPISNSKFLSP